LDRDVGASRSATNDKESGVQRTQLMGILAALTWGMCAHAADGDLDTGFAGIGRKLVDVSSGAGDTGQILQIQPDGKLLMAGTCTKSETYNGHTDDFPKFCATRLRADGSYDTSFGPGGVGYIRFDRFESQAFPHNSRLKGVIRLNDGRLVFMGSGSDGSEMLMAVLTADGSALDASVAQGAGFFGLKFGTVSSQGTVLLGQTDGKILVIGQAVGPNGNDDMAALRLMPDFSLDTSFGNGGYQTVAFDLGGPSGINTDIVLGASLQPDGAIVLAGAAIATAGNLAEMAIARLLPNGQLDADFGINHDGRAHFSYDAMSIAEAVKVDAQGRIVVVGIVQNSSATVIRGLANRLLANGEQDPDFNASSGIGNPQLFFASPIGGFNFACGLTSVAPQADGSIIAAGSAVRDTGGATSYFMAVKFTASGAFAPGNSFGIGGKTYNTFAPSAASSSIDNGTAIAIGNGGLMIGGSSTNAAGTDVRFGIARLKLDAIFIQGFEN
jgi:uncharacterized delta-60 repeat protein